MKHLNSEGVAMIAAMVFPSVPNNQTSPKSAAVVAVKIAKDIYLEAIRTVEEHDAELESDRN